MKFNPKHSLTAIETLLNTLRKMAREWADRAGLHSLPDEFSPVAEAEARCLLATLNQSPDSDFLLAQIQKFREQRPELQQQVDAYRAKYETPAATAQLYAAPARWQSSLCVALACWLIGLCVGLSAKGWFMLAAVAAILILQLGALTSLAPRLAPRWRDYRVYRRAAANLRWIGRRERALRKQAFSSQKQEHLSEKLIQSVVSVALAYYQLHRTRAQRAAELIDRLS